MKQFSRSISLAVAAASVAFVAGCTSPVVAQTGAAAPAGGAPVPAAGVSRPGFESKPILTSPISGDDQKEIVVISVAIAPGASSPVHTHPGDCVGTVVEGQIELRATGKDTRQVSAGTAFANPKGTVHQFVNTGDKPARLLTTLVVEKGKPRTIMQAETK